MNNINHRFKLPQNSSASTLHLRRKSSVSVKSKALTTPDNCLFCSRKLKETYYPKMIVKALYSKFASSQNYYYTRDINDILANNRTKAVIFQKDLNCYLEEDEEYLKRYYQINENSFKMKLLVEYYKFHKDIPRLFMQPTSDTLNRYHDKKRRLEYVRIKKMLKKEQEKTENNNKSLVTESNNNIDETGNSFKDHGYEGKLNPQMIGNVLEGIDLEAKEEGPKRELARLLNQQKNNCEVSNSYSLLDLNKKLLDMTEMKSELFIEEKNMKFHDLSNFLTFERNNKGKKKILDDLSEIEREVTDSEFCMVNLPIKDIFKEGDKKHSNNKNNGKKDNAHDDIRVNMNKEIMKGVKKLDLSKIKKFEENTHKIESARPVSSNKKLPIKGTIEIKTHRNNPISEKLNSNNGLYKINSERGVYEKNKKNFVEIANEAANKIINKSQNILKKENIINQKQQMLTTTTSNNNNMNKPNHNRVNSLYSNNNKNPIHVKKDGGSPLLRNTPNMATFNNFFKTKTKSAIRRETPEENYNLNKNQSNNQKNLGSSIRKNPSFTDKKISHKYTKSDPNLLFPKMMVGIPTINNSNNSNNYNNININNQGLFSIKETAKKIEHNKKASLINLNTLKNEGENANNMKKNTTSRGNLQNQQYYTINQNNILNIYFGEDTKGIFIYSLK